MQPLTVEIPGFKTLSLRHLVLDYNGTIAVDGRLIDGVAEMLSALSETMAIHIVTADTFGMVRRQTEGIPAEITVLPVKRQDRGKLKYIRSLGAESTACIGNGRNDRLMLRESAIGIVLVQMEGASAASVASADIVCIDILSALELFSNPLRLIATLRS